MIKDETINTGVGNVFDGLGIPDAACTRAHGEGEHPRGATVTSDSHRTTRTSRVSR